VILQDEGFVLPQRLRNALSLRRFVHDSGEVGKQCMVFEERARILRDRIEQLADRRPSFAMQRMRVCGCAYVWPCRMYLRVNRGRDDVDGKMTLDDCASMIYQNQIRHANLTEVHSERTHPEVIQAFGTASLMCPAAPSSNPKRENSRNSTASRCLRCRRCPSMVTKVGGFGR